MIFFRFLSTCQGFFFLKVSTVKVVAHELCFCSRCRLVEFCDSTYYVHREKHVLGSMKKTYL